MKAVLVLVLSWQPVAGAAPTPNVGLELVADFKTSDTPVTTDKIGVLDPEELNPHRARWVLERKVQLKGLEAVPAGPERFRVNAAQLESHATGSMRAAGPWYRPLAEFPCTENRVEAFATREATRAALEAAGQAWLDLLKGEKNRLALIFGRITAPSRRAALERAVAAFDSWNRGLEQRWQNEGRVRADKAAWEFDSEEAEKSGVCEKKTETVTLDWPRMMESLPTVAPKKPLVIAPARRWNGLFSVRLNMEVGTRKINGQFLIDSGARRSILSPQWLDGQGILPTWVNDRGSEVEKVTWSGGAGLARRASVDKVVMSGFPLALTEFLSFDTDFFNPPDFIASCCDGILGMDFLRKYVVEFLPGPPTEVKVWPREGYLTEGTWLETHLASEAELVSDCAAEGKGSAVLKTARWMTGLEEDLQVAASGKREKSGWNLQCGPTSLARELELETVSPDSRHALLGHSGFEVGIPVLARGPFTLDLPHGRIWFSKKNLEGVIRDNHTGLTLAYQFARNDRVLKALKIAKGTPASELGRHGLREGTRILEVDGKPAEDLDLWEVERRLSGVYGDSVSLRWQDGKVVKVAKLKTRPE